MEHLHFSQIIDIAEGRSAPDPAARQHLAECADCASDLAWVGRIIGLMRDLYSQEAPAAAVDRVKALFRRRGKSAAAGLIPALIRFDSYRNAPAFGLRAAAAIERQLLLSAGAYDIELRIAPAHALWAISGQILGYSGPAGVVELLGTTNMAHGDLNQLHEFSLPPVQAGRYHLSLRLGDQVIVVPGLDIGA